MQPNTMDNQERLLAFLATGVYSAPEIQQRFGFSQPVISRLLTQLDDRVLAIGKARARRYSRLRDLRGLGGNFPVYAIDAEGNARLLGTLYCVAQSDFLWQPQDGREQLFKSLPWFLADLHPEGFVGRAFVRNCHQELGLPPRSNDWQEDHALMALVRRGEDTMGNLVVGQESLERYFRMIQEAAGTIPAAARTERYPRLAQEAMEGQPVGSSAGGEQPKFTATIEQGGMVQNVLVKFSPPVASEEGRRWADLLVCEHHALQITQQTGIAAAQSMVLEAGGRLFLEVLRFDRTGLHGRLPIISLRAVDNEFYGYQDNWVNAANRMEKDGRLSAQDASALRWLSVFSSLIANNDQHFGNVSLIMADGSKRFSLAPAYDLLPMLYRPMDGAAPVRNFTPPAAVPGAHQEWVAAFECACQFWNRVRVDTRISEPFRRICVENLATLERLKTAPRLL
ncbi:type II toxin-antitoxin system HipA family toxin YjjJ [Trichlorobacter lovleyi]|uniref:type II toxin-antitoxin system HipA family toxin YjjJ n=1 Tax=Trichlorobacter lovleyi TaxID=313985 RepID=UPI00223F660D|nr:type II toxin-antitoxin system HipA family toxin YjjJ [Trichlorobacter lovleyi]QOX77507.1 type II toxin-antitoxin system HipA family toxin YjjJ [Trichlorobacter lovleyi]